MSLAIEILTSDQHRCRVCLTGRLDTNTAPELDRKMASIDCQANPTQIIDLALLDYISSAGLRSLFKAKKLAADKGSKVLLVNPQPQVKKVFDIIKALPAESIFSSQAELDHYLDAMQKSPE